MAVPGLGAVTGEHIPLYPDLTMVPSRLTGRSTGGMATESQSGRRVMRVQIARGARRLQLYRR
jgi:hypothetical protein